MDARPPDPYEPVPNQVKSWRPTCIPIENIVGCAPINLMVIFKYESKVLARCDQDELILPTSIYPPAWDQRDKLESKIMDSALRNADTCLVRARSTLTQTERISHLLCKRGVCYRSKKDKENIMVPGGHPPLYKQGVKLDALVNKQAASRGPQGKAEPRRTKTSKPTPEDLCMFSLQLCLKKGKYWYLKYDTTNRGIHNHMRIPFEEQHRRMETRSQEERNQVAIFSSLTHAGSAQALSQSLFGTLPPSKNQLYYNQQLHDGTLGKLSQAQELIQYLNHEVDKGQKKYIALFHEVTKTSLLAISKYELRRVASSCRIVDEQYSDLMLSVEAPNEGGKIETTTLPVTNEKDRFGLGEALHSIRNSLQVGKKVLLAVAWSREDERKLFTKFPEVIMIDVTMGTNSQGLPEAVICCPGPDMKMYTPVRAFLPSQCNWVFGWLWGTALPTLLGSEKLTRTQLVLSDGDCKIYNSFEEHRSKFYPNAVHALCIFHLVTKPITDAGSKFLMKDNSFVKDQIATFKQWVFTWMKIGGVESEHEFNKSHELLMNWLSSFREQNICQKHFGSAQKALEHNSRQLEEMLLTIMNHKQKWFFPSRKHLLHLQQKSTSALEGVFSTTKSLSGKSVTPNMTLLTSVKTQDLQAQNRMNELRRQWQLDIEATPLWANTTSAKELTTMAESLKQAISMEKNNYDMRVGPKGRSIELLRKKQKGIFCHECNNCYAEFCGTCFMQSPIPKWRRVRTISFDHVSSDLYAVHCTCLHNDGYPCRHFASLTEILAGHFIPRYHKKYISFFGEPGYEELTEHYRARLID